MATPTLDDVIADCLRSGEKARVKSAEATQTPKPGDGLRKVAAALRSTKSDALSWEELYAVKGGV